MMLVVIVMVMLLAVLTHHLIILMLILIFMHIIYPGDPDIRHKTPTGENANVLHMLIRGNHLSNTTTLTQVFVQPWRIV